MTKNLKRWLFVCILAALALAACNHEASSSSFFSESNSAVAKAVNGGDSFQEDFEMTPLWKCGILGDDMFVLCRDSDIIDENASFNLKENSYSIYIARRISEKSRAEL